MCAHVNGKLYSDSHPCANVCFNIKWKDTHVWD